MDKDPMNEFIDTLNEDIEYSINTVTIWAKNVWFFLEEFSNFCIENHIIM